MRLALLLVSATSFGLLVGCGSDRTVDSTIRLDGEYALETVNGVTLPFLKSTSASERVEVVSGALTLRPDLTYDGQIVEQWSAANGAIQLFPETSSGTYRVSGTQLTFTEVVSGAVYYGDISGTRIHATLLDVTFGFVQK